MTTIDTSAAWTELDEVMEDSFELPSQTRKVTPEYVQRAEAAIADRKVRRFSSFEGESAAQYKLRVLGGVVKNEADAVFVGEGMTVKTTDGEFKVTGEAPQLKRIVAGYGKLTVSVRFHGGWYYWQVTDKREPLPGAKKRGRKPKSEAAAK